MDFKDNFLTDTDFFLFKRVSIPERYNFYEFLAVLIDGGVNISEAILSTGDKTRNVFFKKKIQELHTYLSSGDSLSRSMKKIPQIFEPAEVSIIEAGEQTGTVTASLFKLSEELKKVHNLHLKIKSALTYPTIIFLFLIASVVIVLTYVIPAIKPLFDSSEVELPTATKALIATSDFLQNNFILLIFFVVFLFLMFTAYKNTERGKANMHFILLGLPLVGTVYKNYILSNIASNLGTLVGSGVNILKALTLVSKTADNMVYEALFTSIIDKVSKGSKVTDAMKEVDEHHQFFPPDYVQMLAVWERTASMETVAKKISDQYTREVDHSLANLTRWIEPIAILLAWVFVLWFAFAIFGAILKVTQTVS